MTKRRDSDEARIEDLVYLALKILNEEGNGKEAGELMDTLEKRGKANRIRKRLENKVSGIKDWRVRFHDTARVFVCGGCLVRGGKLGWKVTPYGVTPYGKRALKSESQEDFIVACKKAYRESEKKAEKARRSQQTI